MSSVVISGDTSGAITLQAPAVAGNTTLNLPASSGTIVTQNSSAPANSFVVDASGNVGIGTSSPSVKFQVNGEIRSTNGTEEVIVSGTNGAIEIVRTAGNPFIDFKSAIAEDFDCRIQQDNNGLAFSTGGNGAAPERMRITSNGGISFGSSGTAYGTSGQVLQSNGDAAPTWVTPAAGGVTSLNGQTGAITNTSLYAIGSYIVGRPANATNYAVNSTIAGSSLFATTGSGSWITSSGTWRIPSGPTLINTGTWRCVSPAYSTGSEGWAGLWVRIS